MAVDLKTQKSPSSYLHRLAEFQIERDHTNALDPIGRLFAFVTVRSGGVFFDAVGHFGVVFMKEVRVPTKKKKKKERG